MPTTRKLFSTDIFLKFQETHCKHENKTRLSESKHEHENDALRLKTTRTRWCSCHERTPIVQRYLLSYPRTSTASLWVSVVALITINRRILVEGEKQKSELNVYNMPE